MPAPAERGRGLGKDGVEAGLQQVQQLKFERPPVRGSLSGQPFVQVFGNGKRKLTVPIQ